MRAYAIRVDAWVELIQRRSASADIVVILSGNISIIESVSEVIIYIKSCAKIN